ncbi:hypothetical protein R80B4_02519 [Fibrobacteres bacterium R8-0-B4]
MVIYFYYMGAKDGRKKDVVIAARHRCGANQKEFAAWLGITPQYLSQIELGDVQASDKVMKNLERVLSERGIQDAIRSPGEAAAIDFYRLLPNEARLAVDSFVSVLTPLVKSAAHLRDG